MSVDAEAILILGKELRRDRPRALRELWARSAAAAITSRESGARVLSLEAPLQGQEEAGSRIVARMLAELGVPAEVVLLEETTRSTREEALALKRLADHHGWRRTLAVTAAYHLPRSRRYFYEVLGKDRVEVVSPEDLLPRASPRERALILDGAPDPDAMAAERRVEVTFLALARALSPLPDALRWELEVLAGGLYRGIDGLRGSGSTGATRGRVASG